MLSNKPYKTPDPEHLPSSHLREATHPDATGVSLVSYVGAHPPDLCNMLTLWKPESVAPILALTLTL